MTILDPPLWASLTALVAAVVGGLGLLWLWVSTSSRDVPPGPSTMDLRSETPALVDLLTGGFEVDDDAVPATAIDLASRGHFDIEEYGGEVIFRMRTRTGDALTAYESRVLRHIAHHAHDGVVPAAVLTIGDEGVSERWFRGFVREVTKHGRSLALCRRRFDARHLALGSVLVAIGLAPAVMVAAFTRRTDDPTGWGSFGNLTLALALLGGGGLVYLSARMVATESQADTPAGRDAAAHWLGVREFYRASGRFADKPAASVAIWERHLAYATAMGLAPVVQRQLPFETEHDRHAWSRATGQWRRVKVRYQSFRPGWGLHPGRVAFGGLVRAAVFAAIAYGALVVARSDEQLETLEPDQRRWVSLAAAIVAVIAIVSAAYGAAKLVIGVADLFPRRTIEGEVVRRRRFRTGHRLPKVVRWIVWSGTDEHGMRRDQRRRTKYHLAVDDGESDRILAHRVRPEIHARAAQGAAVRLEVSPILGYVSQIEVLSPPRPSAATAPAVLHPMVEAGLSTVTATAALKIDEALVRAGEITDEQGRSLLEQTDDDGITVGEKLREGRARLDELRSDPRVAASPLAGLLDAFATGAVVDADSPPD